MNKSSKTSSNEGVIATNVSAQVMAVGRNATANQTLSVGDSKQLGSCIAELRQEFANLQIPDRAKAAISEHIDQLAEEAAKPTPDRGRLETAAKAVAGSAKLLAEFVSDASKILSPIAKIAAFLGLALF
ncbi:hypothetical protein [uncultured Bradyrhizobium sp.]|jgi:hypothetical protein|uniref:hypothetical protein n=1 Tax=uncultured Bradyrhizobium sp. TaxID=199684 RepID=UPI0026341F9C|nr:hypothetical protein [uncultured Bradyrhizobium sp.]